VKVGTMFANAKREEKTMTLMEKLIAAAHTEIFHGNGAQHSITLWKAESIIRDLANTLEGEEMVTKLSEKMAILTLRAHEKQEVLSWDELAKAALAVVRGMVG
jgi:flagellin-specific chaperone FliS